MARKKLRVSKTKFFRLLIPEPKSTTEPTISVEDDLQTQTTIEVDIVV